MMEMLIAVVQALMVSLEMSGGMLAWWWQPLSSHEDNDVMS